MWAVSASECSASCGRTDFDSAASILPLSIDIALTLDYREIAQQCLACAAAAWHVEAKTRWLELAERWRRLAEEVEGHATQAQLAVKPRNLN
jgi:hypothetical protein